MDLARCLFDPKKCTNRLAKQDIRAISEPWDCWEGSLAKQTKTAPSHPLQLSVACQRRRFQVASLTRHTPLRPKTRHFPSLNQATFLASRGTGHPGLEAINPTFALSSSTALPWLAARKRKKRNLRVMPLVRAPSKLPSRMQHAPSAPPAELSETSTDKTGQCRTQKTANGKQSANPAIHHEPRSRLLPTR